MELPALLDRLGYLKSPNYLRRDAGDLESVVDYGHIFRRAVKPPCMLQGVYSLRESPSMSVPLVYVCDTSTEDDAAEIHRLVWNQNVVPFLILNSPEAVRLYPGFSHRRGTRRERGIEEVLAAYGAADVARIIDGVAAEAIDSGRTWHEWGRHVRPEYRVDWRLLESLKELDKWLQSDADLPSDVSHALIGKYVYLHYLRDRDILSPRKLDKWGIQATAVFGGDATVEGLRHVVGELEEWLNGEVFPIDFGSPHGPGDEHVRRVAGTFAGDQPLDDGTWQLHLDFKAYEFSYIPIETLSVVYEQFLHAPPPGKGGKTGTGKSKGAYYTPIPVVNLMLSEMEEHRPLKKGMRIFDPACGSGAFLVQAFRRLIEKTFLPRKRAGLDPIALRELLTSHIYGVDTEKDACAVTELGLILTLLDYVDPPDLENNGPGRKPKLPKLRDENIFRDNFFHEKGRWQRALSRDKPAWIVGNPPWKQLNPKKLLEQEKPAWDWMQANSGDRPVGSNQIARAFAWRVASFLAQDGEVALFLPAMTLFERPARAFRKAFFRRMSVRTVSNFANLAEVISARRFRVPGAAFFYAPRTSGIDGPDEEEAIRTYSPLVANQEATRPVEEGRRNETWTLIINASEIRDIPAPAVADGGGLPWKVATWGSNLDTRLLAALGKRVKSLGVLEKEGVLVVSQGLELRAAKEGGEGAEKEPEEVELVEEVIGKSKLNVKAVKGLRSFFVFPEQALQPVAPELYYARKGRASLPLSVCRSPHVIVSAARNFAIYTEDYLVVPARQIGIVSPTGHRDLLKAISLFLSSDFAFYHQFLTSSQFGVQRGLATLGALREMPLPLASLARDDLTGWSDLHARLVRATEQAFAPEAMLGSSMPEQTATGAIVTGGLWDELNRRVSDVLGLDPEDRALVHDLVRVRFQLNDGKLGREAVRKPRVPEVRIYAESLKSELDSFVEGQIGKWHKVGVVCDDLSGMVQIDLIGNRHEAGRPAIARAGGPTARALEATRRRLRRQRSQWVYFDRNLRIYEGSKTYILKPMQRFHWTQTQARIDAREIVSETLAGET